MLRRDYILRMIEEFIQAISRIRALKNEHRVQEATASTKEEFKRVIGLRPEEVLQLSDTQLLAHLIRSEPAQAVREKMLILTTLLKEAGDLAAAEGEAHNARGYHLKGLQFLLEDATEDALSERPDFVPQVDDFVLALEGEDLPLGTQALLMRHYELSGQFGKAEDVLFGMLETEPTNPRIRELGRAFYDRLKTQSDTALLAGNLPRAELESGLAELQENPAELG